MKFQTLMLLVVFFASSAVLGGDNDTREKRVAATSDGEGVRAKECAEKLGPMIHYMMTMLEKLEEGNEEIENHFQSTKQKVTACLNMDTKYVSEKIKSDAVNFTTGMWAPLQTAAFKENNKTHRGLEVAKLLLKHKANVNDDYLSPLLIAVRYQHSELAKLLLEQDEINVNARDRPSGSNLTPLHYAVQGKMVNTVRLLLNKKGKNGIEVNATDTKGKTPLFFPASGYWYDSDETYRDIVQLLLENGADPEIEDDNDYSVAQSENKKVQKVLQEHKQKQKEKQIQEEAKAKAQAEKQEN